MARRLSKQAVEAVAKSLVVREGSSLQVRIFPHIATDKSYKLVLLDPETSARFEITTDVELRAFCNKLDRLYRQRQFAAVLCPHRQARLLQEEIAAEARANRF